MKKRGRKSAAELSTVTIDGPETRLKPPSTLSDAERKVFRDLVRACDSEHFAPSDLPLLCRYCEAIVLAETAALELRQGAVVNGKPSPWIVIQEKSVRAIVALSLRLRLSPQARLRVARPDAFAGRRKPWDIGEPDEHLETWE
jgi:phage terminase small subunit